MGKQAHGWGLRAIIQPCLREPTTRQVDDSRHRAEGWFQDSKTHVFACIAVNDLRGSRYGELALLGFVLRISGQEATCLIKTEQAPPYAPSAKGTVESLFRWMTQRFEKRLPNSSYGVHDVETAAQAGGMTLEELERCFYQAIVDDYQRDVDTLRHQRRYLLWEQAVAASGVPQYLGSPDDLKLLLMKAVNRKTPHHGYRVQNSNRLSFLGRWYVCPGLLSRLQGSEFDLYFDRRDVSVLYIFVEGEYVGEAYCPQLMGGRVSEWEARAMRKYDEEQARIAREQGLPVRARIQDEARAARRRRS